MGNTPSPVYVFGPYRLDAREKLLFREGQPIPLSPKALEILLVLVRSSGQLVEKDRLLNEVWPDTFVEEGNLAVHMTALRKALGQSSTIGESAWIETLPRRGYRFCVPVEAVWEERPLLVVERRVETSIVREEIEEEIAPARISAGRAFAVAASIVLVMGAAFVGWRILKNAAASPSAPMRVVLFASYPGTVQGPAFAPDGEKMAFPWTGSADDNLDIYVKMTGNDPPLRLTSDPAPDRNPAWSPDGRQIAFLRETASAVEIRLVAALGAAERKLTEVPHARYYDLDWSPDGRYIAFAERTDPREPYNSHRFLAIFLLSLDTLEKRQITFPRDPERDQRFAFSPDGTTLAFLRHGESRSAILLLPMGGGEPSMIHQQSGWIGHLAWMADGQRLVFTSDHEGGSKLFRIAATGGTPEPLPFAEDSAYSPAIAARGNRLAYVREHGDVDLWRVELEDVRGPGKAPALLLSSARSESAPEFSPDGSRIAFFSGGTGRLELWASNADGRDPIALTNFHASTTYGPSWSPDGKQLAFASVHGPGDSQGGVFVLNVHTREVRRLTDDAHALPSWSRDGRWIYLAAFRSRATDGIWKIPAQGGQPILVTPRGNLLAQESPDGRTLYYSRISGGIWKMPVDGGEETPVLPDFTGELRGYWRVVEDGIYYLNKNSEPGPALEFFEFATRQSQRIAVLTGNYSVYHGGLTVSPDRRWIVYSQTSRTSNEIMLVENFR